MKDGEFAMHVLWKIKHQRRELLATAYFKGNFPPEETGLFGKLEPAEREFIDRDISLHPSLEELLLGPLAEQERLQTE